MHSTARADQIAAVHSACYLFMELSVLHFPLLIIFLDVFHFLFTACTLITLQFSGKLCQLLVQLLLFLQLLCQCILRKQKAQGAETSRDKDNSRPMGFILTGDCCTVDSTKYITTLCSFGCHAHHEVQAMR